MYASLKRSVTCAVARGFALFFLLLYLTNVDIKPNCRWKCLEVWNQLWKIVLACSCHRLILRFLRNRILRDSCSWFGRLFFGVAYLASWCLTLAAESVRYRGTCLHCLVQQLQCEHVLLSPFLFGYDLMWVGGT